MDETEPRIQDVRDHIEMIYRKIATRPQIFAGRTDRIEANIMALEGVLDVVDGSERKGDCLSFQCEDQFGSETRATFFERVHACRGGLVPYATPQPSNPSRSSVKGSTQNSWHTGPPIWRGARNNVGNRVHD